MEKETNKEQKRNLRSSPARSKRALAAASAALSSDDEGVGVVSTTKSTTKKQAARKSPGRPARAAAKQQNQPMLDSPLPAGLFGREYQLRSKDSKEAAAVVSSDEEESVPVVTRKSKASDSTRMSLSESNFRRQINKGGSTSKKATSTPQPKASTDQSPVIKTKLKFDSSQLRRSGRNRGPVLTIERVTDDKNPQKNPEKNLSVVAEAEEDDEPKEEKGRPMPEEGGDNYPAWPPVGWKEFLLAGFVTGLAAIGYVCYTTDYCRFC